MKKLFFSNESGRFATAIEALKGQRVAVLGHVRPDGDCIGSQVALVRVMRQLGVDAVAYNEHRIPPNCADFVHDTPFYCGVDAIEADRIVVSVDCADRKRLGKLAEKFTRYYLNVDHHISNTGYAEVNLIVGTTSATGELLAGIFLDNGYPIDPVTAQALYVGIATDTGQFRFSSTSRVTFEICCHLLELGADPATAALNLYESESPAKLALLQHFLASFRFRCGGRVCLGVIDEAAWVATGAAKEDTEGLVDYARSIAGVEIGVLLEAYGGHVKGSFRAKNPRHRVDLLAKAFNGGGHACAAGFNPQCSLTEALQRIESALEEHFHQLDQEEQNG